MNAPVRLPVLQTVAHAAITSDSDTVACPIGNGRLPARACALRHVARDTGTHRHPGEKFPAARYPACAACSLGGVAQQRLGIPGTPGKAPKPAHGYLFENDAVVVIRRFTRTPEPPDDFPNVRRTPVQPHPRSATFETWLAEQQPVEREPVVVQRRSPLTATEGRETPAAAAKRLGVNRNALQHRAEYVELDLREGLTPGQWDELAVGLARVSP
jgi:hypothetical protein